MADNVADWYLFHRSYSLIAERISFLILKVGKVYKSGIRIRYSTRCCNGDCIELEFSNPDCSGNSNQQ